jgi:two-component system, sensor histidine kinase and response regulator
MGDSGRPPVVRALTIGALIVATFIIDVSSGTEISASIFYLIPIALMTWSYGRVPGLVVSVFCALLWLIGEVILGQTYSHAFIPVWNMLVRLAFFVIVTMTLAARRRIETDLVRAQLAALQATRAKSDFVSRVTHELRTPLAAIVGFSDLMERRSAPFMSDQDRELLRRIQINAASLLTLVEGVLDLGRAEGSQGPAIERVHLPDLVTGIVGDFRARRPSSDVKLIIDLPATLLPLETNAGLFNQIVINLVSNAVKFTEQGHVRIGVKSNSRQQPVELFVQDTGIGIAPQRVEAIFKPFEQADGSIHTRYGGAGLGLAITRDLCQRLGYQLLVDTRQGVGSCFSVVLQPQHT